MNPRAKLLIAIAVVLTAFFIFAVKKAPIATLPLNLISNGAKKLPEQPRTWQIKSVDTMKYSRDNSAAKLNDSSFDSTINEQISNIKSLGATHVVIATPYDEHFIPIMTRWVEAARANNLSVWFRGNFSGWEGWFGQSKSLTRQEHEKLIAEFIHNHPDLFKNGDIFSACPECENGGPGDPRQGDLEGFRKFMIEEHVISDKAFLDIGKKVQTNYASMNYDVASLVMDKDTLDSMGNLIVVDHYVKTAQKLKQDLQALHEKTGGSIFLGEFGAPIPDIHGKMSPTEQSEWVGDALDQLTGEKYLIGVNYWTSVGGSTAIYSTTGEVKPAADKLREFFQKKNLN